MARGLSSIKIRKKPPRQSSRAIYVKMMGAAPVPPADLADRNDVRLIGIISWYSARYKMANERREARGFVVEWMRKNGWESEDVSDFLKAPLADSSTGSVVGVAKMLLDGYRLPEDVVERFRTRVAELVREGEKVRGEAKPDRKAEDRPSISERVSEVRSAIIGEVEGLLDDMGHEFDMYSFLQSREVKPGHAGRICAKFARVRDELREAAQWQDPQLREAYAHEGRAGVKRLLGLYEKFVADCERYVGNARANKPARKPKERSAPKQVEKMLYLKQWPELQLVSIDPARVVGAAELWTYNVRYKWLTRYVCRESSGFKIHRTSLKNFDVDASETRVLRKPEQVLAQVLKGTPASLRRVLPALTSKPSKPNGRINEQTVLLRVV